MATTYVSSSATNGYGLGHDTTGDGTKATPYLTIAKAITVVGAGDTIKINDGTYTESTTLAPADANLTISPETARGVTIRAGASPVLRIDAAATGITVGAVVIDGAGLRDVCVGFDGTDAVAAATFSGTRLTGFVVQGLAIAVKARSITFTGDWAIDRTQAASGSIYGIDFRPDDAASLTLTGGTIAIESIATSGSQSAIMMLPSAAACSLSVSGGSFRVNNTAANGTANVRTVRSAGVGTVSILNATISANANNTVTQVQPISIENNATACSSCTVRGNTLTGAGKALTGYGILIGAEDATNANSISKAVVEQNTITSANHGVMLGFITSGVVRRNRISDVAYGSLLKGTTTCKSYANIISSATINGLYIKYGTNDVFANNTVIVDVAATSAPMKVSANGGDNTTGAVFKNNVVLRTVAGSLTAMALVEASQAATFTYNGYVNAAGAMTWEYDGTADATIAAWNGRAYASAEVTGTSAAYGADFKPSDSSFSSVGTWIAGIVGYDDLPLPLHPDIGAVQDRDYPGRKTGVGGGSL